MTLPLFDASALLVLLQGEDDAVAVEAALVGGGAVPATGWAEVAQRVRAAGADWALARGLLRSWGVVVEAVTEQDAEGAAARWARGSGLSLADRVCLAQGARLGVEVWTADRAWGEQDGVRQVR